MAEKRTPNLHKALKDVDPDSLVVNANELEPDSLHSWRREKSHVDVANAYPSLATLLEQIELIDRFRNPDTESEAYRGALLAVTALAQVALKEAPESQAEDDEMVEPLSLASFLRALESGEIATAYNRALFQVRQDAQRTRRTDVELIVADIKEAYPELYDFIGELCEDRGSEDFSAGVMAGATEMLWMIKTLAEIDDLKRSLEQD